MARPAGFEPATLCLEGRCSIHLSYGRTGLNFSYYQRFRYCAIFVSRNDWASMDGFFNQEKVGGFQTELYGPYFISAV